LSVNQGWLEASGLGIITAIDITEAANDRVRSALDEIDTLLCELISPEGKEIPEAEMLARWQWPEVDLEQLLVDEL
jgi:hypothetical protein